MPDVVAQLSARPQDGRYHLRLYVTGNTPLSSRAISNIKALCEKHLKDRFVLTIIDLYEHKELAQADQILAAPTLIRDLPLPVRRLIGDLSHEDRVLVALDLPPTEPQ